MSQTVVVASQNPVKIEAAQRGFTQAFPEETFTFEGVSAESGVSAQPLSDAETLQGAMNRALNAQHDHPHATYWVGIEGGIDDINGEMQVFAWIVIMGKIHLSKMQIGKGKTGTFYLPQELAKLIRQGKELGEADDHFFRRSNSKQQNGAIGLLTNDLIDRTTYYEHAVIMALIPFLNGKLAF